MFRGLSYLLNIIKIRLYLINFLFIIILAFYTFINKKQYHKIYWSQLKSMIGQNNTIDKIELINNKEAIIYTLENKYYKMNINDNFEERIYSINTDIDVDHIYPSVLESSLNTIISTLLILGLFLIFAKLLDVFTTTPKKNITEKTNVKIEDVRGCFNSKTEVLEIADIVLEPKKYLELGTKIPKGVLMEGPPGTGKTLLAKAIADKYNTNFYLMSGSDFIQPLVGMGSKKVKNLFKLARDTAPSIIFIDEIDAIGKSRTKNTSISNDERDNILNSILVEMDGFNQNKSVLVIGATNRVDTLDKALLRPGRFDRKVNFKLPIFEERKDIILYYWNKYCIDKNLDKETQIDKITNITYGFSCADIENIFNEASIDAGKNNDKYINQSNIDNAIDYILLGNKLKKTINSDEKETIAYHEAGHAILSYLLPGVNNPSKVSIIPRSKGALGFSQSIPEEDKNLYTKDELHAQIMVLMGGRLSEQLFLNKITNGAYDDIEKLNQIAYNVIAHFGMNTKIGFRKIDLRQQNYWRKESDKLVSELDKEINALLKDLEEKTIKILEANKETIVNIKELLIEKETIDFNDIDTIVTNKNQ